jgi:hypothetical protein
MTVFEAAVIYEGGFDVQFNLNFALAGLKASSQDIAKPKIVICMQ